jgi:hypothetical protein
MLRDEIGIGAPQPFAADREAAEALDLFDSGLLQQVKRTAACADENELGVDGLLRAGPQVGDLEVPRAVGLLGDVPDVAAEVDRATGAGDVVQQLTGEGTEVDVGSRITGSRLVNSSGLSMYSMPSNNGLEASAS